MTKYYPADVSPLKHPYREYSLYELLEILETAVLAYGMSGRRDNSHVELIKREIRRRHNHALYAEAVKEALVNSI